MWLNVKPKRVATFVRRNVFVYKVPLTVFLNALCVRNTTQQMPRVKIIIKGTQDGILLNFDR